MQLFTAQGFAAVTVEDIAAASGYTRVSVYNHFRGKPMIYLYLVQRDTERLVVAISQEIQSAAPGLGMFDAMLNGMVRWVEDNPSFFFLYFVAREEVERDMTRAQRRAVEESHYRLLEVVRDVFKQGIAAGAFHDIDAPTAANLFFANLVGAVLLHRTHSFRASMPQLLRATAHYFLRGVGAAKGAFALSYYAKQPVRHKKRATPAATRAQPGNGSG
jgi:AcrR family transcriptional regulator